MASRGSVLACTVLLVLSVASLLAVDHSDDSEGYNDGFTSVRDGDAVTVTGHGTVEWDDSWGGLKTLTIVPEGGEVNIDTSAFQNEVALETVTIQGSVGSIGIDAFYDCLALTTVTITGPVTSIGIDAFFNCLALTTVTITGPIETIGIDAFLGCSNLKTVNIACNDPLNITKGSGDNGDIARYADTVNHVHRYSAAYDWADDGKSCTVHIVCANTAAHNHDESPAVTSTVKIQPTETTMGTTEYSVSGTYDGFAYSDTKDVQDIPATGGSGDGKKDNTVLYIAVGGAIAAIVLIGGFFLLRRRRLS